MDFPCVWWPPGDILTRWKWWDWCQGKVGKGGGGGLVTPKECGSDVLKVGPLRRGFPCRSLIPMLLCGQDSTLFCL